MPRGFHVEEVPPPAPPSETVLALRRNYKMAVISQFIHLFKAHIGLDFCVEALELDLEGQRPLSVIPAILGKLLNTLAADRNVNSSNWMVALRRQYSRRLKDNNPFIEIVKVPVSKVDLEINGVTATETAKIGKIEIEGAAPSEHSSSELVKTEVTPSASTEANVDTNENEVTLENGDLSGNTAMEVDNLYSIKEKAGKEEPTPARINDEELTRGVSSNTLVADTSAEGGKMDMSSDIHMNSSEAPPAIDDDTKAPQNYKAEESEAKISELPVPTALNGDKEGEKNGLDLKPDLLPSPTPTTAENNEVLSTSAVVKHVSDDGSMEFVDEVREVSWLSVSLETKVDAIYNVCEWHMLEPERFRRQLRFEEDDGWRIEPIGSDAKGNKYFYLDDHRLWIQRVPPPAPRASLKVTLQKVKPVVPPVTPLRNTKNSQRASNTKAVQEVSNSSPSVKVKAQPNSSLTPSSTTKGRGPPKDRSRASALSTSSGPSAKQSSRNERALSRTKTADTPQDASLQTPPSSSSKTRRSSGPLLPSANANANEPPRKRMRTSRLRGSNGEVWQEIPEELLKQWSTPEKAVQMDVAAPSLSDDERRRSLDVKESSSAPSSVLTSLSELSDLSDLDESDVEKPLELPKVSEDQVKKNIEEPNGDLIEEVEEKEADEVQEVVEKKNNSKNVDIDQRMKWEIDYWNERKRCEIGGFVEWEVLCASLQDWEAFPGIFAKSKDRHERALREWVAIEILPIVTEFYVQKEKQRLTDIAVMNRKRSSRIAIKESEEEERIRKAKERAEISERLSRASRHKVIPNFTDDGSASDSSAGLHAVRGASGPPQESREDRLKKREEEKLAREAVAEQQAIEDAYKAERQAIKDAHGGKIPPELMTPEELAEVKKEEERERKRREKEDREAAKKERKRERARERKLEKLAALQTVEDEPPWYLDCEICQRKGWNMDEEAELIACERCEEWQHLGCYARQNAASGQPPVDYASIDFICSRCRADPRRTPRVVPNKPPEAAAGLAALASVAIKSELESKPSTNPVIGGDGQLVKEKRKYKPRQPKLGPDGLPIPRAPKMKKEHLEGNESSRYQPATNQAGSSSGARQASYYSQSTHSSPPLRHYANGNIGEQPRPYGHSPSLGGFAAPIHRSTNSNGSPTFASTSSGAPATAVQSPGQPALDYPSLLALIKTKPVLINQLPPNYQQHFSALLGIPVPYTGPSIPYHADSPHMSGNPISSQAPRNVAETTSIPSHSPALPHTGSHGQQSPSLSPSVNGFSSTQDAAKSRQLAFPSLGSSYTPRPAEKVLLASDARIAPTQFSPSPKLHHSPKLHQASQNSKTSSSPVSVSQAMLSTPTSFASDAQQAAPPPEKKTIAVIEPKRDATFSANEDRGSAEMPVKSARAHEGAAAEQMQNLSSLTSMPANVAIGSDAGVVTSMAPETIDVAQPSSHAASSAAMD